MVVLFLFIPQHLQQNIVKKMEIKDRVDFQLSSKDAYHIADSVKWKPSLQVSKVLCSDKSLDFFFLCERDLGRHQILRTLEELAELGFSSFAIKKIHLGEKMSLEKLDEWKATAHFVKCNTIMDWTEQWHVNPAEIFKKVKKVFHVKQFVVETESNYYYTELELLFLPEFHQLESVCNRTNPIPDEMLLKLQAHTINFAGLESDPDIFSTINTFFKQWFAKDRCIKLFIMPTENVSMENDATEIFAELPFSFVWSYDNHENSILSECSKEEAAIILGDEFIYVIERGDKKLLVMLDSNTISAQETDDIEEIKRWLRRDD